MAPPSAIGLVAVSDTEALVLPSPLTVNGVSARRAKAGKLIAGTAAATSSDHFKSKVGSHHIFSSIGADNSVFWKTQSKEMGP